jgi:drug/metabolite transporter (DMT)-like permease
MNAPSPNRLPLSLLIATLVLAAVGWTGVILITNQTLPTVGPRWLFFVVWLIALTGTAIPFAHYLNKRFAKVMPPDGVMLRQSLWVGLFGATCAWLLLGRALNWASALLLAAALIAIEGFLILRDRSRRPFDDSAPTAKR